MSLDESEAQANEPKKRPRDWTVQGDAFWYDVCETFVKRNKLQPSYSQKEFISEHPELIENQGGTLSRNLKKYRDGELQRYKKKHSRNEKFREAKMQMIRQLAQPENQGISWDTKIKLVANIDAKKPTTQCKITAWLKKVDNENEQAKKKVKEDLNEIGHNNLTLSQKIEIAKKYVPDMDADIYASWVEAMVQELLNEVPVDTQATHNHSSAVVTTVQSEEDEEDKLYLDFMEEMSQWFSTCSLTGDQDLVVPESLQGDLDDDEATAVFIAEACVRSVGQAAQSAADEKSKATAKSEGVCSVADVQSLLNGSIGSFEMKSVFGSTMKEQLGETLSQFSSDTPIDVASFLTTSRGLQLVEEPLANAGDFDAVDDMKTIREILDSLTGMQAQNELKAKEIIVREQEVGNLDSDELISEQGLSNALRLEGITTAKEYIDEAANLYRKGDLHNAREMAQRALNEHNQLKAFGAPDSLESAVSYNACGMLCEDAGDSAYAKTLYERAIEIQERLAHDSLELATSYNNIGSLLRITGDAVDVIAAKDFLEKGLRIRQNHATESMAIATSYNNIALLYRDQGKGCLALQFHLQALEIQKKIDPYSQQTATSFQNIGRLYESQGDTGMPEALNCYVQAVLIDEQYAPDALQTAKAYTKIAEIYKAQGSPYYTQALNYFHKSEQIFANQNPLSKDAASLYSNIGCLNAHQEDFLSAWQFYHKSLELEEHLEPDSLAVAFRCDDIALLCESQNDEDQALKYYQKAIRIKEKHVSNLSATAGPSYVSRELSHEVI